MFQQAKKDAQDQHILAIDCESNAHGVPAADDPHGPGINSTRAVERSKNPEGGHGCRQ